MKEPQKKHRKDAKANQLLKTYETLALSEHWRKDPEDQTHTPSDEQVENARDWSESHKL